MDVAQMQQMIQDHGYTNDTATAQLDFLNATYREIHSKERWPFLEALDQTMNTVEGTANYSLTGGSPGINLNGGNWRNLDAVRIDQPDQQSFIEIEYKQPQDLFDSLHIDQFETATPRYWTFYAQQIWFYPIPDSVYRVSIYYITEPPDMSAPGDIPLIPTPFHDVIVAGAICRIAFRERDWIGLELWTQKYESLIKRLEEEYKLTQRQTSSEVRHSGYWDTNINYPLTSTGF